MTTLTARGVVTGAAMLQLIAAHVGMTERDFETGAYLDKLDPALDITARDIITGAYVDKLNAAAPSPTGLMLVATGATEAVDGDYQRFVYDGVHAPEVAPEFFYPVWFAEIPTGQRQSEYQITLKMPQLSGDQAVNVLITDLDISVPALNARDFNYLALELRANEGSTGLLLNIADDQPNSSSVGFLQPASGSVITLTLTTSSLDYAYDGGTGSIAIPVGFFGNLPNVWPTSGAMDAVDVMPLSIKVGDAA